MGAHFGERILTVSGPGTTMAIKPSELCEAPQVATVWSGHMSMHGLVK